MGNTLLPPLYSSSNPINHKKVSDLLELLTLIPPVYHFFYQSLKQTTTASKDNEDNHESSVETDED